MHGVSFGQSPLFIHIVPPLELLELVADEEDDEEDVDPEEDDEEDELPPVPLDELELPATSPPAPPVALPGSN